MISEQVAAAAHLGRNLAALPNTTDFAAIQFSYQPTVVFDKRVQSFIWVSDSSEILVFVQMFSDDLKLGLHEIL